MHSFTIAIIIVFCLLYFFLVFPNFFLNFLKCPNFLNIVLGKF